MNIDAAGLVDEALYIASPNCDDRPPDAAIELLVIHNISLPPGIFGGTAVADLFMNRLDPQAHPYFEGIAAAAGVRAFFHPPRWCAVAVRAVRAACLARRVVAVVRPRALQ